MMRAEKNGALYLTLLCSFLYFASYLTRYNYAAVLVEIVANEGITKTLASMSLTGQFVAYGIGQMVSGFLGDRIAPSKLITGGLFTSAVANFCMSFCTNPWQMLFVWCVNGFAQSMIWPPLVKIMVSNLTDRQYKKASVVVSSVSSIGTVSVYLLSPFCIALWGWRVVFRVCGGIALIMVAIWALLYNKTTSLCIKNDTLQTAAKAKGKLALKGIEWVMFVLILISIASQGLLRDGITSWMPTLMRETFNLKTTVSILTGVALPMFAIVSFKIATAINKKIPNEITTGTICFGAGFVALVCMALFGIKNNSLAVLCMTLATGAMHGVNLMLICMLPSRFSKFGCVSTVSGILNTCTYVGSALSSFGIAMFTDSFGWSVTVIVWCAIAFIGLITCLLGKGLYDRLIGN